MKRLLIILILTGLFLMSCKTTEPYPDEPYRKLPSVPMGYPR